jgi:hypothetical protein
MGMNIALMSYHKGVYFGFSGDVNAAPDLELLPEFLQESFSELRSAVLAPEPRKRRPPRAKAARTPRPSKTTEAAVSVAATPEAEPQPV